MPRTKPCPEAAYHLALGALSKGGEVPPGNHDLSGIELTLTFPALAAVTRGAGTSGDGYDTGKVASPGLDPMAVLLFLDRAKIGGPGAHQLWLDAIRDAARGLTAEPPAEAGDALKEFVATLPPQEPGLRKTPAKRIGAEEISIKIRRLPKPKRAAP